MKENTIVLALLSALLVTPAAAQNGDAKAELASLKPGDDAKDAPQRIAAREVWRGAGVVLLLRPLSVSFNST